MPKLAVFPRRRPRTPSRTERVVGLMLIIVLVVIVGLFVLSGTRPGPAGLPQAAMPGRDAGEAAVSLPLTSPAGWPRGEVERYDEDSLFEKINGKADAYVLYRFEHLLFATYTRPTDPDTYVDLYVYVMGSALDAFGTYRGQRSGHEKALDVGDEAVVSSGAVFLRRGPIYVEVVASGPAAEDEALALARILGSTQVVAPALGRDNAVAPDPLEEVPPFPSEGLVIVRFDRKNALGVGALQDTFIGIYDDGTQLVVSLLDTSEAAKAAATQAAEDIAFLGEAATFVVRDTRVIGVVGEQDETLRQARLEALLRALEWDE